jgi:glucose-6-phosphate isomerase
MDCNDMSPTLTRLPAWQRLAQHAKERFDLRMLFERDPDRFSRYSLRCGGILLDYSKHWLNDDTLRFLVALAEARGLREQVARMMAGEAVNFTEGRAALHTALRADRPVMRAGRDVTADIARVRSAMRSFSDALRRGCVSGATGRPITDVVNIGIGGSDLGPLLACEALAPYASKAVRVHFMSNVDGAHVERVLAALEPDSTLAIIASKTFSTQETMTNARTVRAWLERALGGDAAGHWAAVTANTEAARRFGIGTERIFEFWDWVGGRYSVWSAVGLPVAIAVGMDAYESMCAGAREMDEHFARAPFDGNMPVLLALLGIWYGDFHGCATHAVLPYDSRLSTFPLTCSSWRWKATASASRARAPSPITRPARWSGARPAPTDSMRSSSCSIRARKSFLRTSSCAGSRTTGCRSTMRSCWRTALRRARP